uniref:Uncharacterized protein n=1 Tax=Strigamia maritima TaxID=126957 RepID=T1J841_STRMM
NSVLHHGRLTFTTLHIEKMTVFIFTSILLVLSFTNLSLQFEWNVLGTKCEEYPEKVQECWLEKYEVPTCDDKDSLLECAEDAKNDVRNCKEEVRKTINNKYNIIKTLRDAMCENTDLRDEFVKRPSCWLTTRTCASDLAVLADDEEMEEDACGQLLESMESCNFLSGLGKCQEMQANFTLEVFKASTCVSHAEKLLDLDGAASVATSCSIIVVVATAVLAAAI